MISLYLQHTKFFKTRTNILIRIQNTNVFCVFVAVNEQMTDSYLVWFVPFKSLKGVLSDIALETLQEMWSNPQIVTKQSTTRNETSNKPVKYKAISIRHVSDVLKSKWSEIKVQLGNRSDIVFFVFCSKTTKRYKKQFNSFLLCFL